MPLENSVVVALLGLLCVLFLWRERLTWYSKALIFSMGDFAAVSLFFEALGRYLVLNQIIPILVIGYGLIPVAFILSWPTNAPKQPKGEMLSQVEERKKDVWYAIKEWVESPIQVGFGLNRGQEDFLLATEPPTLAAEVDTCLKHYPTVWNTLQEFRTICVTPIGSVTPNGMAIENAMRGVTRLNMKLIQEIRSEILDKHYTQLKC